MNPETRTLLRVEVDDAAEADEIFTMLMGEKVEPRKDFIKTEAARCRTLTSEAATLGRRPGARGTHSRSSPHGCFACGTLNAHGPAAWTSTSSAVAAGPSSSLPERFAGLGRTSRTAGSSRTILDEVMAWALIERRPLGPHRPDHGRLQAAGPDRPAHPRRGLDQPSATPPRRDGRGAALDRCATATRSSRRPTALLRRAPRGAQGRRSRRATGSASSPDGAGRATADAGGAGMTDGRTAEAARRPRQPDHRARHRVRRRAHGRRAEALGRGSAEHIHDPAASREPLHDALSRGSPIRSTSRASTASRRASGPTHGVRWPLLAAVLRGLQGGDATRAAATLLFLADRPPRTSRRSRRAGSRSACSSGPFADEPERTLAAAPPRRARGRRLGHGRRARPPVRHAASSRSPTAGPSSSSSSTRRPAGSAASSARRSRRCPHVRPRRRAASRRRRARPGAPRPAHRRRRARTSRRRSRGPPVARRRSTSPRPWRCLRTEAATAAATDDGHRAWVIRDACRSSPRRSRSELKDALGSIRSRRDQPNTSVAAATAAGFLGARARGPRYAARRPPDHPALTVTDRRRPTT